MTGSKTLRWGGWFGWLVWVTGCKTLRWGGWFGWLVWVTDSSSDSEEIMIFIRCQKKN